jgi:hypothetical protein
MGRRASSSLNAPLIVGIIAAIIVAAVLGFFLLQKKTETFTDAPLLHISEALDNANSLRGNEYRVEGKVESRWVRDTGEGLSLKVEEDGRTEYFFIMIPPDIEHVNIEREQRYAFKIRFGEGGVAVATAVKRL